MTSLLTLDTALFRFLNQSLANGLCDLLMPMFAGGRWFVPLVGFVVVALAWKGGTRGRVFLLLAFLAVIVTDVGICGPLKAAIGRPRPFITVAETHLLAGRGLSGSMPSSHAANWGALSMVTLLYYGRRGWFVALVAAVVAFSRIYVGVHYPSDVLVGLLLGAGAAAALVVLLSWAWQTLGRTWFPLAWARSPSLTRPELPATLELIPSIPDPNVLYLRLGFLLIGLCLVARLLYLAAGSIELSKDEAYQWVWSKHLALSYFSKPAGIALIQFAGTFLWGDTQFGVRFFSPIFAALLSLVLLRFLAREIGARPAFLLLLILVATPLMEAGTILMTIDPPLVVCWTCAMFIGWRAVQPNGTTTHWMLAGIALGLGFLCKYTAAYQILCWALLFVLWPPARVHLRRPGPYLALLLFLLCTLPVIVWNSQHGWITVRHVSDNAGLNRPWQPTFKYLFDFALSEFALLNPVFFVGSLWAAVAVWRRRSENALQLFFLCMGLPVFLGHVVYALRSAIQPNWIVPAVLPMFCVMVAHWDERWRAGIRAVKYWLICGLALGFLATVILHDSNLISKIAGRPLPAERDPLRRVRGWKETVDVIEAARQKLLVEGRPVFIIHDHYGMTGLTTFYLPEAREAVHAQPLAYYESAVLPRNQFYFWPGYSERRRDQNAIYVSEYGPMKLRADWVWRWLTGQQVEYASNQPAPIKAPAILLREFESVTDLGIRDVVSRGRVLHQVQLFECRGLK